MNDESVVVFYMTKGIRRTNHVILGRTLRDVVCVETKNMSSARGAGEKLLITTYQEVNDLFRSNTRCDDENVRDGGNTDLPEQHFHQKHKAYKVLLWLSWT